MVLTKRNWLLIGGLVIFIAGVIAIGIFMTERSSPAMEKSPTGEKAKEKEIPKESMPTKPEEVSPISEIDTSNWKTYKNLKQRFEIKLPPVGEWDYDIRIDEIDERTGLAFFDGFLKTQEEKSYLRFLIRINLFSEITPFFPPDPFCQAKREITLWNYKILQKVFSSYSPQIKTEKLEECDSTLDRFLLDEHSIETRVCLNKDLKAYDAEFGRNGEYFFYCTEEDPLYYFSLYCKGEIWAGKEGSDRCNKLFNQILSTFKFIKK